MECAVAALGSIVLSSSPQGIDVVWRPDDRNQHRIEIVIDGTSRIRGTALGAGSWRLPHQPGPATVFIDGAQVVGIAANG
jgi:hypothetical protein